MWGSSFFRGIFISAAFGWFLLLELISSDPTLLPRVQLTVDYTFLGRGDTGSTEELQTLPASRIRAPAGVGLQGDDRVVLCLST